MKQRTKYIQIRVTEEEAQLIRDKSAAYSSISHFIRSAIAEYSNIDAKQRLQLIDDLGKFYRENRNELSHIGGNFNQSVKRANELSVAGLLSGTYISEVLMPEIIRVGKFLDSINRQLLSLTKKATTL